MSLDVEQQGRQITVTYHSDDGKASVTVVGSDIDDIDAESIADKYDLEEKSKS